jgi:FkbH-like protein
MNDENKSMKKFKLAILGDKSMQFISKEIARIGPQFGFDFELYNADFDQIDQTIKNPFSALYEFNPNGIFVFYTAESIQEKFFLTDLKKRQDFFKFFIDEILQINEEIKTRIPAAKVYISNLAEVSDGVYGNNSNKYPVSLLNNIRRINLGLSELSEKESNLFILDMALLQSTYGRKFLFDPRLYVAAELTLAGEGVEILANQLLSLIKSTDGGFKKCLILDLDNTMWGGVIGDDGLEKIEIGFLGNGKAFTRLQTWAKELQMRGILLAICSKNDEEVAKEPFLKHPEMVLRLDDIAIFVANWNDKASNIKFIQSILNIGFDSMVFIDDNSFERELVKRELPDVQVPDLPVDPTDYFDFLCNLNLFEPGKLSALDLDRTKMIQTEMERNNLKNKFSNESDFLKSIHMVGKIEEFNAFNTPRVAQLSERSNQYNLRTIRYSEAEVHKIAQAKNQIGLTISLQDTLGDHGLIAVIVLEKKDKILFIENWFMSCRVLKRGVEFLAQNKIVKCAINLGCKTIIGEYIPTSKNGLVKNHYLELGFSDLNDGKWALSVGEYDQKEHFIREE